MPDVGFLTCSKGLARDDCDARATLWFETPEWRCAHVVTEQLFELEPTLMAVNN